MGPDSHPAGPGGTEPTGGNSSRLLRFGGSERARLGLPGLPDPLGLRPPAQGELSPLTPSSRPPEPRPPRSRPGPGPRLLPPRRAEGASAAAVLEGSVGGKSWLRAPRPPRGGPPGLPGRAAEEPGALAGVGGPAGGRGCSAPLGSSAGMARIPSAVAGGSSARPPPRGHPEGEAGEGREGQLPAQRHEQPGPQGALRRAAPAAAPSWSAFGPG